MDKLPPELLERVLSHLSPADRLKSALISPRWAQTLCSPALLRDICLTLRGAEVYTAEAVILKNNRPYRSLRLLEGDLFSYNSGFWTKVGKNLRKLALIECIWRTEVFYSILRECPNLECLEICAELLDPPIKTEDFRLPNGLQLETIQASLSNVRHVHLRLHLTGALFATILSLMPNVAAISLSNFDEESDFLSAFPIVLGADRAITKLDLGHKRLVENDWERLLNATKNSLQELLFEDYALSGETYEIIGDCSKLRHLKFRGNLLFSDDHLQKILVNCSELESLDLHSCKSISDEGLRHIVQLKKLRKLKLFLTCYGGDFDFAVTTECLCLLGSISTLQHINVFSSERVVNARVLQSFTRLPNLETLDVGGLHYGPECLKIILQNFKNVKQLKIQNRLGRRFEIEWEKEPGELQRRQNGERKIVKKVNAACSTSEKESSSLESLSLDGCRVTDVGLVAMADHHSRLKAFTLADCEDVTDAGLVEFLQREPLLENLRVLSTDTLNGGFLTELEDDENLCPRLHHLEVTNCRKISSDAIDLFKARRPAVKVPDEEY